MKVEKELVDVFHLRTDDMMMLNQIIQKAFRCNENDPNFERMREYRVFLQVERHFSMSLITLKET